MVYTAAAAAAAYFRLPIRLFRKEHIFFFPKIIWPGTANANIGIYRAFVKKLV